jgi:pimeloyl-ACP methyl ester carboxylesterase
VAAVEPTSFSLMDDQERAGLGAAVARMSELAAEGNLTEAARAFLGVAFNGDEVAIADEADYFEATGRYIPTLLKQLPQTTRSEGPGPDDPEVLGAIPVPVLVLYGSDTKPFLAAAGHVADHVPNARLREIAGAGHAAPLPHPEALPTRSRSTSPRPSRRTESACAVTVSVRLRRTAPTSTRPAGTANPA